MKSIMMIAFFLFCSASSPGVSGFMVAVGEHTSSSVGRPLTAALAAIVEDIDPGQQFQGDFPTPKQKIELRKIITKRAARKELPWFVMPEEENLGPFPSSLPEIRQLLDSEEIVEVRGISKDSKRQVYATFERLVAELGMEMNKDVTIISTKGFSAVIYSEMDNDHANVEKKIMLRTSVGQKNTWTRRVKAPRDNRGQIIK
jgi:hypothetical protein